MSEVAASKQPGQRRWTPGATLWFLWMVGMWVASYTLLFADKLEGLWRVTLVVCFTIGWVPRVPPTPQVA